MITGLACTSCRQKKIRCSRSVPVCQRCRGLNIPCHYPQRQTRRRRNGAFVDHPTGNRALDMILERLQRVEESTANSFPTSSSSPRPAREVAATPSTEASEPSSSSKASRTWVPSTVGSSCIAASMPLNRASSVLPRQQNSASPMLMAPARLDVSSVLSEAVSQVQELKGFRNAGLNAFVTEGISIPPELARTWIHNYFTYMPAELFLTLVDRKLIEMIPDLLCMRHVKLDACMLLVYYAILYHGCFLPGKRSYGSPDKKYASQLYICCLRTIHVWQREATGTATDFIAAIYMTRTSAECFDFDLSWEMHKLACEYAQGLQMHSLDENHNFSTVGSPSSDDDRRGMWELIQMDLFYRLIYNKPAMFSFDLACWRVNLPWLSLDSPPDKEAAVPTMTFIVSSRLTFILITFFQMFDQLEAGTVALEAIEPLCREVEDLMEEWGIDDWIRSFRHDEVYTWILTDLALAGYTCIILMLRKVTLGSGSPESRSLDADIPRTDLARKASRQILSLIHYMLHEVNLPKPEALSSVLGTYRAYMAYAYLANGVMNSPMTSAVAEDMDLLERVTRSVEIVAVEEKDFVPFARALKYVNVEVQRCR